MKTQRILVSYVPDRVVDSSDIAIIETRIKMLA